MMMMKWVLRSDATCGRYTGWWWRRRIIGWFKNFSSPKENEREFFFYLEEWEWKIPAFLLSYERGVFPLQIYTFLKRWGVSLMVNLQDNELMPLLPIIYSLHLFTRFPFFFYHVKLFFNHHSVNNANLTYPKLPLN